MGRSVSAYVAFGVQLDAAPFYDAETGEERLGLALIRRGEKPAPGEPMWKFMGRLEDGAPVELLRLGFLGEEDEPKVVLALKGTMTKAKLHEALALSLERPASAVLDRARSFCAEHDLELSTPEWVLFMEETQ